MTDTVRELREIRKLLARIAAVIAPDKRAKLKGGASVSSLTKNAITGTVTDSGDDGDIPSQLTADERAAMAGRGRNTGRRRDTRRIE